MKFLVVVCLFLTSRNLTNQIEQINFNKLNNQFNTLKNDEVVQLKEEIKDIFRLKFQTPSYGQL